MTIIMTIRCAYAICMYIRLIHGIVVPKDFPNKYIRIELEEMHSFHLSDQTPKIISLFSFSFLSLPLFSLSHTLPHIFIIPINYRNLIFFSTSSILYIQYKEEERSSHQDFFLKRTYYSEIEIEI